MADIKIICQDDTLLVLDKPAGLVVDPAATVKEQTLADILSADFGIKLFRGGIVHRLDKDTSGIMLVAKTQGTLENLQSQFKQRKIKKEYLALVHGKLTDKGRVEGNIGRNPKNREKFTVLEEGKEAVTEYDPIQRLEISEKRLVEIFSGFSKIQMRKLNAKRYSLFTLVACRPLTGRTHQIRVHLKYIGHPIVSDQKYVGRKMYRLDSRWCPRMFLHATKLGFYHPVSGQWMEVESDLPADLEKALENLGKYG